MYIVSLDDLLFIVFPGHVKVLIPGNLTCRALINKLQNRMKGTRSRRPILIRQPTRAFVIVFLSFSFFATPVNNLGCEE